jgi:hypothetical protein
MINRASKILLFIARYRIGIRNSIECIARRKVLRKRVTDIISFYITNRKIGVEFGFSTIE